MKLGTIIGICGVVVIHGSYRAYERHQHLAQPMDVAMRPGEICDRVAARSEDRPTVGWYHACINYAAEVAERQKAINN